MFGCHDWAFAKSEADTLKQIRPQRILRYTLKQIEVVLFRYFVYEYFLQRAWKCVLVLCFASLVGPAFGNIHFSFIIDKIKMNLVLEINNTG